MAGDDDDRRVTLEYALLGGPNVSVDLAPGEAWSFGRDRRCTETLVLSTLSRSALTIRYLEPGLCRVSSRQSGLGRVLIDSDDGPEHHTVALGSGPVHLLGGNYMIKVELPPVVLRLSMAIAVVGLTDRAAPSMVVSPLAAAERTGVPWAPEDPGPDAHPWISVAALAVAVHRYPELVGQARPSESLRRLCGLWCGHSSLYWVNERLKEAVEAADLVVPEGGERLALAVAHYGRVFPHATIRQLRDAVLARLDAAP